MDKQDNINPIGSAPPTYSHPSQLHEASQAVASLTKLLLQAGQILTVLRREFRGEALYQLADGTSTWVQVTKPIFIRINAETEKPIKKQETMPDGETKEVYVPNDEAIEEILSMLKFVGMNQITPISNISDDNILDDLKEFECKLASTLCLKQKEWGIDKELLPMLQTKIKTIVQDARYMACKGGTLKALQTTVQRVEQAWEGEKFSKKSQIASPYGS